jgi:glycosyltransferase involved in cell wall biosynthesis
MATPVGDHPELATWGAGAGRLRRGGHVGVVLPCFNEEANLAELHERLARAFAGLPDYTFEMLFIDNASTDGTAAEVGRLAAADPRVRLIVNARNFGHIRSPFHALMTAGGDCVISMSTDLQDPPELIPRFIEAWEQGASVAVGQKRSSAEAPLFWLVRSVYYRLARSIAEVPLLEHVTGFGLYDRRVLEIMRSYRDPYPYVRGLISEIGLPISVIQYDQPLRKRGLTKNNFFTLYDMAMLGITSHSKAPLRLATLGGFALSFLSLLLAILFLVAKLLFWYSLPAGYAPAVISIFFLASVQIFLIGLVGEYVGAVLTQVRQRPMVIEARREPAHAPAHDVAR